jgi:hypothetical protein
MFVPSIVLPLSLLPADAGALAVLRLPDVSANHCAFLSHCCFTGVFASLRPVIFVSVVRGIPLVAGFPAVTGKLTIIKNPSY